MKRMAIAAVLAVCSLAGAGCASERYAHHEREWYARTDTLDAMTKDDVIALANAGVSDNVIIDQIKTTHSSFQLSTQDIVDLANAGVGDKVISAMIKSDEQGRSDGGYYYPYPSWYWYADYPFVYPWYPSFFLGFSFTHYHPFYAHRLYSPRFVGHGGFYGGGRGFRGGGGGFGGYRSGGRHR